MRGLQAQAQRPDAVQTGAGAASGVAAEALEAARAELDAAIEAIRGVEGYEDFFRPPTWEKIVEAAVAPGVPLAYLVATPAGGVALVVRREDATRLGRGGVAGWVDGGKAAGDGVRPGG